MHKSLKLRVTAIFILILGLYSSPTYSAMHPGSLKNSTDIPGKKPMIQKADSFFRLTNGGLKFLLSKEKTAKEEEKTAKEKATKEEPSKKKAKVAKDKWAKEKRPTTQKDDQTSSLKTAISILLVMNLCLLSYVAYLKRNLWLPAIHKARKRRRNESVDSDQEYGCEETSAESQSIQNETVEETPSTGKAITSDDTEEKEDAGHEEKRGFARFSDRWAAVGVSVKGSGHIETGLPCQDNNGYLDLGNGWSILVVSDGAGSARLSHIGSLITVERTIFHFSNLIAEKQWCRSNILPTDEEWNEEAYNTLRLVHEDLNRYAELKEIDLKDLNATVIVTINSPVGVISCHVGDGRAGYQTESGEWKALMTPHKGQEANQTIFITTGFWNIPYFRLSGVRVPETRIIREPIRSITLMSDGCEGTCWQCNLFDKESGKYYDPNLPYPGFFDKIVPTLLEAWDSGEDESELLASWHDFVEKGNQGFIDETDDRTLIILTQKQQLT